MSIHKACSKKWHICLLLYMVGVLIVGHSAFINDAVQNKTDAEHEYNLYLQYAETGLWKPLNDNLLASCVMTTYVPALIQRATNLNKEVFYRWYLSLLIPLLPVLLFLIASLYMEWYYALIGIGVMFIMMLYISNAAAYGRTNVALIFYALLFYIWLNKNIRLRWKSAVIPLCATGIAVSHYSVAYISLITLSPVGVVMLIQWLRKMVDKKRLILASVVILSLLVSVVVWEGVINTMPMAYAKQVTGKTIGSIPYKLSELSVTGEVKSVLVDDSLLANSDIVIRQAFGLEFGNMSIMQKVKWAYNWLLIGLLVYGLWLSLRSKKWSLEHKVIGAVAFLLILLPIANTYISNAYGIGKIYYQALVPLSGCFGIGVKHLVRRLQPL